MGSAREKPAIGGSLGSVFPHISNWNWWHFPITYCLVGIIELFITWALAGFVMVKIMDKFDGKTIPETS
ncbi:MAG: hypothetical protein JKX97_06535 [Candidatus Lindowbacteria bacterium]|nr:hypothetical protein [Candidatus Lindowbacteria bacterium]